MARYGRFDVTLNRVPSKQVSVDYQTLDGTAIGGTDYAPMSGTLYFNGGSYSGSILVPLADSAPTTSKTFFLELLNPVNCTLSSSPKMSLVQNPSSNENMTAATDPSIGGYLLQTVLPSIGNVYNLDFLNYGVFSCNLISPQSTIKIVNGANLTGMARQVQIILKQRTGANQVSWPANIFWAVGRPPVLSLQTNAIDIIQLMTINGGASWIGTQLDGWIADA